MTCSCVVSLFIFFCAITGYGNRGASQLSAQKIIEGFGVIWSLEPLNSKEILFTAREGKMFRLKLESKKTEEISGIPAVFREGQGGLFDVAIHPEFQSNQIIFLAYSRSVGKGSTTALARARLQGNKLVDLKEIFLAEPSNSEDIHCGGRLLIDSKKNLWLTIGDRNNRHEAQNTKNHLGKLLRFDLEGKAHSENPSNKISGSKPEIFSIGHRNPQGIAEDSEGQVWIHEHGPRGGDELNLIKASAKSLSKNSRSRGAREGSAEASSLDVAQADRPSNEGSESFWIGSNYGWPVITYGREYWGPKIGEGVAKEGMEQPVHKYIPSIAPSGMVIYKGEKFKDLKGSFLIGALAGKHINLVNVKDKKFISETRLFEDLKERVRDITSTESGEIFFSTDSGKIYKVHE